MLEIRLNCENCGTSLPNHSDMAMICTYECTFYEDCVNEILMNVCSNCGGGFEKRPTRPKAQLSKYPPRNGKILKPIKNNTYLKENKNINPRKR